MPAVASNPFLVLVLLGVIGGAYLQISWLQNAKAATSGKVLRPGVKAAVGEDATVSARLAGMCTDAYLNACLTSEGESIIGNDTYAVDEWKADSCFPQMPEVWSASPNFIQGMANSVTRRLTPNSISEGDVTAASRVDGHCDIVQIINNSAYFHPTSMRHSKCPVWTASGDEQCQFAFLNDRRVQVLHLINAALQRWGGLENDVEIVVCLGDGPVPERPMMYTPEGTWPVSSCADVATSTDGFAGEKRHAHVWSPIVCAGQPNVPFPMMVDRPGAEGSIRVWDKVREEVKANRAKYAYAQKEDRIIFRGGYRTWYPDLVPEGELAGRHKLFELAKVWQPADFVYDDPIPLSEQERFKFVLYAEGHYGWADRLRLLLHMGTGLLMQQAPCVEYYGLGLIPGVHMLPVDYRFRNIKSMYRFAMQNPAYVQQMIQNMHAYAEAVLSADNILLYTHYLLKKQQRALAYEVKPRFPRYKAHEIDLLLKTNCSIPLFDHP